MDGVRLKAEDIFDPVIGAHYSYIKSIKDTSRIHCHDFFEFFAVLNGSVIHHVNLEKQWLTDGHLVFIRPDDMHYYEKEEGNDCEIINLAFSQETVDKLFDYLGNGFSPERLLSPSIPPFILMTPNERNWMLSRLEKLNTLPLSNKSQIKTDMRIILAELFARCFPVSTSEPEINIPYWLKILMHKLQQKENFTAGLPRLYELAGKTPEHISRSFRKYLNSTPTEFINHLKLNYAANLLVNTDESVLWICLESGFDNLSHFYHLFNERYSISPLGYRKINRRRII